MCLATASTTSTLPLLPRHRKSRHLACYCHIIQGPVPSCTSKDKLAHLRGNEPFLRYISNWWILLRDRPVPHVNQYMVKGLPFPILQRGTVNPALPLRIFTTSIIPPTQHQDMAQRPDKTHMQLCLPWEYADGKASIRETRLTHRQLLYSPACYVVLVGLISIVLAAASAEKSSPLQPFPLPVLAPLEDHRAVLLLHRTCAAAFCQMSCKSRRYHAAAALTMCNAHRCSSTAFCSCTRSCTSWDVRSDVCLSRGLPTAALFSPCCSGIRHSPATVEYHTEIDGTAAAMQVSPQRSQWPHQCFACVA